MCSRTMLSATKTPVRPTPVLQCTVIGPSWPNCSFVLCTWLMKSMKASPELGTPCSGQSVKWNWRIVRDWPSYKDWEIRLSQYTLYRYVFHIISFNSLLFWTITHLNPPLPSQLSNTPNVRCLSCPLPSFEISSHTKLMEFKY